MEYKIASDFNIEHRKGTLDVVPDTLYRIDCDDLDEGDELPTLGFETLELENKEYQQLRETVSENHESLPDFKIVDGYIQEDEVQPQQRRVRRTLLEALDSEIPHKHLDRSARPT